MTALSLASPVHFGAWIVDKIKAQQKAILVILYLALVNSIPQETTNKV